MKIIIRCRVLFGPQETISLVRYQLTVSCCRAVNSAYFSTSNWNHIRRNCMRYQIQISQVCKNDTTTHKCSCATNTFRLDNLSRLCILFLFFQFPNILLHPFINFNSRHVNNILSIWIYIIQTQWASWKWINRPRRFTTIEKISNVVICFYTNRITLNIKMEKQKSISVLVWAATRKTTKIKLSLSHSRHRSLMRSVVLIT